MIKQTTLHNILTWVIAGILFIFQSLNYFIVWIKKYMKHGEKTTTVVTADTTISSESNPNNKNAQENVITVQRLIQKHFDIPLIIAEDEPKVYNFMKSAQLLTSNEICKEKKKIDEFMENLVDDSYVARGLGLITATVGRQSEFYLYSKYDNNFENIVIKLNGRNGEVGEITISNQNPANIVETEAIPIEYFYDKDRIKVTYTPFAEGVYTLTMVRNSLSICRSPYYISVEKNPTNSRSQIRLGTKKYKPVTKFAKAKHLSLETCDNRIPVIELSKPSICRNILPVSEENSIRTDVMSIVTKFESNNMSVQKKVHKHAPSITEKDSETDLIDDISTYSNIKPKIETDNVNYNNISDLNSHNAQSKSKSTDNNFWNDVDITYRNSKASDINAIDFESERIKKPMTNFNKNIRITKDIPWLKDVSSTHLKPTNSVLKDSLNDGNSHDIEKRHQSFKTTEFIDENTHIETVLDSKTRVDEYEIKCIDNEPCIQNEPSCFDDDDRKTVVVMQNINEMESNKNDTVIQQITDSAQYNISTPFASVITRITNSVCEKCSVQVLKIISEFPRDINIIHENNSKEIRSSFETLLAQPISININIDNMYKHPINAANEQNSEHSLTNSQAEIKRTGTTNKDMKCQYLNEIEPINNNSDELCNDMNNPSTKLTIKTKKPNIEINKTIEDKIIDHCTVPFTENTIDKHKTEDQINEWSTNEILEIKCSTTNKENVLHSNQFNNDTIYKPDNEMEIQGRHLQKSSEHNMGLIETNQFHESINKELNSINKESDKPLNTNDLVTINNDKNINEELVKDEYKINNVIIPDKNTNIQCSVIDNTVLASMEVTLETSKYNSEDNEKQTKNTSFKNVTLASTKNENQKLMIEKSIEPVLISFKNKMVEKITQLYLNKELSNTDNNTIVETHDKHLTNNLKENQIYNIANNTEINTKCIETLTSQLKNHIDKNEISEIILGEKKTANNHLFKYVENIIKTNINRSDMYAQTLGEKKLQTLVNTTMNHPNGQKIDNEFKKTIIDNETQDVKLKKMNNGKKVQDIEAILAETKNVTIVKNTDKLTPTKSEVTVKTECKLPLINDFNDIKIDNTNTDIKQEMQKINENENVIMVETNAVEIKELPNFQKSHNTAIITPIIELQPTLETQKINTLELVTAGEHSLKVIQSTIEIIQSNIPEETDAIENIDDKRENKSVKLQIKENENVIIKIPHLVEKKTTNEILENISTNTSTKSNLTKNVSMQQTKKQEIETLKLKKVSQANDDNIEREIMYTTPVNIAENIFIDKPNPQITPALHEHVSNNAAKITIGIKTLEPQFSNTTITRLTPSKIPIVENNSINPRQRVLNALNKLDAIEKVTIPKYSTTCDTKKAVYKLQHSSESILSLKQFNIMKNIMLKKTENTDKTCTPNDTEIETFEFLNENVKMKSLPPFTNDVSVQTTLESKTDKNTLQKTFNSKHNLTTIESTVNEINCDNNKNETTIQISSTAEKVEEKPIKNHTEIECTPLYDSLSEHDLNVDEMLIGTKAETPGFIVTPTTSSVRKIVVEFVTRMNKNPIETLAIVVHDQIEENNETAKEIPSTMNSLTVVMDEQVNIKTHGSGTYYTKVDDKVKNTETNIRMSIDQKNSEKIIEKEPEVRQKINSIRGVVVEKTKMNISKEKRLPTVTSPSSVEEMKEINKLIVTLPIQSIIEYLNVSKKIEDINKTEKTSCTNSSTIAVEESPEPINATDGVVGENTKDNYNKQNEKLLPIDTSPGSVKQHKEMDELIETLLNIESTVESIEESIKDTLVTAETCTNSATVILDAQTDVDTVIGKEYSVPINSKSAKNIDEEPPVVVLNSSDKVIAENTNEHIDTEKKTFLPIETSTRVIKKLKVKERKTEIILQIELNMQSKEEPKEEKGITETEITTCTESSTKIIDDQHHAHQYVNQELTAESNSSDEVARWKENVKTVINYVIPLPIESVIGSIAEPITAEDITENEIPCNESSTEMISDQKHEARIVFQESPSESNCSNEIIRENTFVNNVTENKTPKCIEPIKEPEMKEDRTKKEIMLNTDSSTTSIEAQSKIEKYIDGESPISINFSDEVVGEKNNMNINTEKEASLITKTNSGLVEKLVIEETTEIVSPIESSLECTDEPKVVGDIMVESEISICSESSTEIIGDQNHVDKIVFHDTPPQSDSVNEIDEENKTVNIDTENKTPLCIEPIEEPEMEENGTKKEIMLNTDSSTTSIEAQSKIEKYIDGESPLSINFSDDVVGEKNNMNINTEKEQSLITKTTSGLVEKLVIEETTEIVSPIESSLECTDEPKVVGDIMVESEISICSESSTEIIGDQNHVDKIVFHDTPPQSDSVNEIDEENKTVNIDTENKTPLCIEPIEEPELEEDRTKKEIMLNTDSSTTSIEAQSKIEKYIDGESPLSINFSDEVVGEKNNMNINTEKEESLITKTTSGLVKKLVIEKTTEIVSPIESSLECTDEPKLVGDIMVESEITICSESSKEIIGDQNHVDKIFFHDTPPQSDSVNEIVEENKTVNIDTENKTPLCIEPIEEPEMEEDRTKKEIMLNTDSSTTSIEAQSKIEKYIDGESPLSINFSDEVVGEKNNMNINTEKEESLITKTTSGLVKKLVIEKTTEIVSPIESSLECTDEPKLVGDIMVESEITICSESSKEIIGDQNHVDKIFFHDTPPQSDSVNEIVEENKTVNIDTENKTPLCIEPIEEPEMEEDRTKKEIMLNTDSSTTSIEAQSKIEKYIDGESPLSINFSDEVVGEKNNMNINTEKEASLITKTTSGLVKKLVIEKTTEIVSPIESSLECTDDPKLVGDIMVESEITICSESSKEIIGDQNHVDKIFFHDTPPQSDSVNEIVEENKTVNIDTENKTPLCIEPIEEPEMEEDRTKKEIMLNTDSSTTSIEAQSKIEKYIDGESPLSINFSDEVVGEKNNMNINTEKEESLITKTTSGLVKKLVIEKTTEIVSPIESSLECTDEPKLVGDIMVESEITICSESSKEIIGDQNHVDKIFFHDTPPQSDSVNEIVEENKTVNIDTENKTPLCIEPIEEPEMEEDRTKKEIMLNTDSSTTSIEAQSKIEKYIDGESPLSINFSDEVVGEKNNMNINTEKEASLITKTTSGLVKKLVIEKTTEIVSPIESSLECTDEPKLVGDIMVESEITICSESSKEIIGDQNHVDKIFFHDTPPQSDSVNEIVEENKTVNIDTENKTPLCIEPIEEPEMEEDRTKKEIMLNTDSSTTSIEAQSKIEKYIDGESPLSINFSDEVVGEKNNMNINTEKEASLITKTTSGLVKKLVIEKTTEIVSPIESSLECTDDPKLVGDIMVESEITICSESSKEIIGDQNHVDKIFFHDTPPQSDSVNEIVEENKTVNIDTENKTPLCIEPIEEPEMEEDRTKKEIMLNTDSSTTSIEAQSKIEKYIDGESPLSINFSDEVVGEKNNMNINTEKEESLITKTTSGLVKKLVIEKTTEIVSPIESSLECTDEPKLVGDIMVESEITICSESSKEIIGDQNHVDKIFFHDTPPQSDSVNEIVEENKTVNIDTENKTPLCIEPIEEPEMEEDRTKKEIMLNTDSSTTSIEAQSKIEKYIDGESPLSINFSDEVVGEKNNMNINTEKEASLITKTTSGLVKKLVIEKTTEIVSPIESSLECTDEPKLVGDIMVESEITICSESSKEIIGDQNHVDKIFFHDTPPQSDSVNEIVEENKTVNIDTENKTPLCIEPIEEPEMEEDRTKKEIMLNTDSSTTSIEAQSKIEKYIDGESPLSINFSDEVVGEKNNMNINTEKEESLITKTTSGLVEKLVIEETTEIVSPIESSLECTDEPKVVGDIMVESEITICSESSTEIIGDQNHVDKIVFHDTPPQSDSVNEVVEENKTVNIDTENKTPLCIEPIEEPEMEEDRTKKEIMLNTDSSTTSIEAQSKIEKYIDGESPISINFSDEVVGEKNTMNINTEKEESLLTKTTSGLVEKLVIEETTEIVSPIESSLECTDEPKVVGDIMVESEITICSESSTEIIGDQNHVDKIVFHDTPPQSDSVNEIVEENKTVNIDTENKTPLCIEPIEEPEMEEDRTKKEIMLNTDSSTTSIEAQSKIEKYIDGESPLSINFSDEVVGEKNNMNINTEKEESLITKTTSGLVKKLVIEKTTEIVSPIESSLECTDEPKLVGDIMVESEITICSESSKEIIGDQNHVDKIFFHDTPPQSDSVNEIVEENKTVNIDTENKTPLCIEPIEEPEMEENGTKKEIMLNTDSSTTCIEAQSKIEKYIDGESPLSINFSDDVVGEKNNMNINTEKEQSLITKTTSGLVEKLVIEETTEIVSPIESSLECTDEPKVVGDIMVESEISICSESSTEIIGDQNHVDKIVFHDTPPQSDSVNEIDEENKTVNIDTENKTPLCIEPIEEPELEEDRTKKEIMLNTDSSTTSIEAQSKIEKYIDGESPLSINFSDEVVGEKNNMNINTEKEESLITKTTSGLVKKLVIEKTTEIVSPIESSLECTDEPKLVGDIMVESEITICSESSKEIIGDQNHVDKIFFHDTPPQSDSVNEIVEENKTVNIDTENKTPLCIEPIEEPEMEEDRTKKEIMLNTDSSTTSIEAQSKIEKYIDGESPLSINFSDEVVGEKNNMNINTEKEESLITKTTSGLVKKLVIEKTTEIVSPIESSLECTDEPKLVGDIMVESEITICSESSKEIIGDQNHVDKIFFHDTPPQSDSVNEIVEENKTVNIDTENKTPLCIEPIEEPEMEEDRTKKEIMLNTDSSTTSIEAQSKIEKYIDGESPLSINFSDEVVGEKNNMNINTEKEASLITKTTSGLVKKLVIEKTTEIVSPIESSLECTDEPKLVGDIMVESEITICSESSKEIIGDQNHVDKIFFHDTPPLSDSVNEIVEENKTVNIDTENKTPLCIEPIEEPEMEEDRTKKEIMLNTDSSTTSIEAQSKIEKYIDGESPLSINFSDEVVGEKNNMNINTEKEESLITKTTSGLVEKLVIEETTEIVSPIESSLECTDEPKVVGDIMVESEITICSESSTEIIGDQNHVDKIFFHDTPPLSDSVNEIVEENKTVNIDTENKTPLCIEPIEEPEMEEDRTKKEIMLNTDSSTTSIEAQSKIEKYIDGESPLSINFSDEVVGEKNNMNINTEKEESLITKTTSGLVEKLVIEETTEIVSPIESSLECTDEPKVVGDIMVESEITICSESSTEIIGDQNHVDKIVFHDTPPQSDSVNEIVEENKTVNIDTENKTPLCIEPIEEPEMEEDRTKKEIMLNTDSSTTSIEAQSKIEKYIDGESPLSINFSDEVVGEKNNMNINTEKEASLITKTTSGLVKKLVIEKTTEIVSPIESSLECTDDPKLVGDIMVESEITICSESSKEIIGDQNHVDKIFFHDTPPQSDSVNEIVEENKTVNIDTENKTPLCIEPIEEPEMEEDRTKKEIMLNTDSSTTSIEAQSKIEKYIDGESPISINFSDEVVGEKNTMNINTEKEESLLTKTTSGLVEKLVIEETTEIVSPIESSLECTDEPKVVGDIMVESEITICSESSTEIIGDQNHVDKIFFHDTPPQSDSVNEVVEENKTVNIDTENKTPLCIEPIEEPEMEEDRTKKEIMLNTDSSTTSIEAQSKIEKYIDGESPVSINFSDEVVGEKNNMNIEVVYDQHHPNTNIDQECQVSNNLADELVGENSNILIGTIIESVDVSKEVVYIFKTEETPCTNSSTVTEDVQTDEGSNIKKELPIPINFLGQVLDGTSKVNTVTENETLLLIESIKVLEPNVEKNTVTAVTSCTDSSNATLDVQTDLEKVVGKESSSLHQFVKKQIVEQITENKNPTIIDTSSEIVGQGKQVDINTEFKTPLSINPSSTTVDGHIVKNVITPIYCLVDATERTKVNIENNIETFTPIDICTASVGEQLNVEYLSKNEHTEQIEKESRDETSAPVNYSASVTIEQTDVHNLAERTLPNDAVLYINTKTNSIGRDIKEENSNNPNNCCLKFGETSQMLSFENEDNLQRKSYGIQKLEMSVQRMKTSNEDYYEKTFVQLEQTEKISEVNNINLDGENKTIIDDKLYTVNESDLNAILCASSLEEALTLLDSKIKFKFKHKKSSKINAKEYIPKIQTSESQNSGVNTNFKDAREFFKEIEKKSKK